MWLDLEGTKDSCWFLMKQRLPTRVNAMSNNSKDPFYLAAFGWFRVICLYLGGIVRQIYMLVKVATIKEGD